MATLLIYTAGNVWNERKVHFSGHFAAGTRVLGLIEEETEVRRQACEGRPASYSFMYHFLKSLSFSVIYVITTIVKICFLLLLI